MRVQILVPALLLVTLSLGGSAFAERQVKTFSPPTQMTQAELAASKAQSKYNINAYGKDIAVKPKPFPWAAVSLLVIVLAIATPFALRYYKSTANELGGSRPSRSERAAVD